MQGDFERDLDKVLSELRDTLVRRHKKYGKGNIAKHGLRGIAVRLDDKMARLEHGLEDHADESVLDTLEDIAGYGVIALMWERGLWPGSEPEAPSHDGTRYGTTFWEQSGLRCQSTSHVLEAQCDKLPLHTGPHRNATRNLIWYNRELI